MACMKSPSLVVCRSLQLTSLIADQLLIIDYKALLKKKKAGISLEAALQWPLTEGKKAAISVISAFDLIPACSSLKPLIEGKIDAWSTQARLPFSNNATKPPHPTLPPAHGMVT